jgi:catechol 2,3-dioxygenase-like lactoylglutathione lyase family enzyme
MAVAIAHLYAQATIPPLAGGLRAADKTSMLGHVSFGVGDLARAKTFYDAIMSALGYACVYADNRFVGYGMPGSSDDKLLLRAVSEARSPGDGFHLCFDAVDEAAVDRFHAAGMAAGGADNGAPGLRPRYGPDYYAAFLIDPDGHHLEAKVAVRG